MYPSEQAMRRRMRADGYDEDEIEAATDERAEYLMQRERDAELEDK